MPLPQLIPELKQTLYVANFGDSLTVMRIILRPERGKREIAVVPVDIDALAGNQLRHRIDHVSPCRRITEIEKAKLHEGPGVISFEVRSFFSDEPLRM